MKKPEVKVTRTEEGWDHYECELFTFAMEFDPEWLNSIIIKSGAVPGSAISDVALERTVRIMFTLATHDLLKGIPFKRLDRTHMRVVRLEYSRS